MLCGKHYSFMPLTYLNRCMNKYQRSKSIYVARILARLLTVMHIALVIIVFSSDSSYVLDLRSNLDLKEIEVPWKRFEGLELCGIIILVCVLLGM